MTPTPEKPVSLARYIMIGGFLGAGKTTAIRQLATRLTAVGKRVGLITNDQGGGLVDTRILRQEGFAVEEIAGGCFCCRFNSLKDAADKLTASTRPDIFFAEPVGSCTDLIASVSYPLRRMYGDTFTVAPLSVLVDPLRALRILGVEKGGTFSEKVCYIYRKQLEEAELICLNKIDVLSEERLRSLRQAIREIYPRAEVREISAREGKGLEGWLSYLTSSVMSTRQTLSLDYQKYGEGEALLGWLNATVRLVGAEEFSGNAYLAQLAETIQRNLQRNDSGDIAHLKMTLSPADGSGELGVVNLVGNDFIPELGQSLTDDLQSGELVVNLRAEVDPDFLRKVLTDALTELSSGADATFSTLTATVEHLENFRPGMPKPTYRLTSADEDV